MDEKKIGLRGEEEEKKKKKKKKTLASSFQYPENTLKQWLLSNLSIF